MPGFLDLPPELRLDIYEMAYHSTPGARFLQEKKQPDGGDDVRWRPKVESTWWRAKAQELLHVCGLDGFENVTKLTLEFGFDESRATCVPDRTDFDLSLHMDDWHPYLLEYGRTARGSCIATLAFLLLHLPGLKTVEIAGSADPDREGITWYGFPFKPLDPAGAFITRLRTMAEDAGVVLTQTIRDEETCSDCQKCSGKWQKGRWRASSFFLNEGLCEDVHDGPYNMDTWLPPFVEGNYFNKWEDSMAE
ncbi:hypothetical protein LTR85_011094 [Meristemomyces frigidus]|nr:hypothetical protein LTR85_011094 [Meristemomyces frigidus]